MIVKIFPCLLIVNIAIAGPRPKLVSNPCQTPNGKPGNCVPLNDCQSLKPHINERVDYLRHSTCGRVNKSPKVCCPVISNSSIPEGKTHFVHSDLLPDKESCGISRIRLVKKPASIVPQYNRTNRISPEIDGGTYALTEEFPWMASLEYEKYEEYDHKSYLSIQCEGSLINKRYVLTAGHCIQDKTNLKSVRLGETNRANQPDCFNSTIRAGSCLRIPVDLERSVIFERYNVETFHSDRYHDIGLVRLAEEVKYTDFISPICLHTTVAELFRSYVGENLTVAGWGKTEHGDYSSSKLKATIPVQNLSACADRLDFGQMCAGADGVGPRDGNSGAPLMYLENNGTRWYIVGIVSKRPDMKRPGHAYEPKYFAKVSKYVSWIVDNLKP